MKKANSKPESVTSQEIVKADGSKEVIQRDNLGRFASGVTGNPKGRPKGSKNRTVIIKQAIEEALTRDLADEVPQIIAQAVEMAKKGDKDMIKFLLGDVMKEVRRADPDEEENKRVGQIHISFSPFNGDTNKARDAIDAEFAEIENPPS